MFYKIKNKVLGMIFATLIVTTGCTKINTEYNNQPEYIEVALNKLQQKYGEEFEVSHVGGSFGATRDTYKLICNPIKICLNSILNVLCKYKYK